MIFQVMNRTNAKKYSYKTHGHKYIIISISDIGDSANKFNKSSELVDVLRLWFDDEEAPHPNCITSKDAEKIVNFVNQYIDKVDEIVVHCSAGVSRSAGVCGAIMCILTGSDDYIFDNPNFCPNMTCYRAVLNAYFGSYDDEEIKRKEAKSIEVWRKANGLD